MNLVRGLSTLKKDLYKTIMSNKGILIIRLFVSVVLAFAGPLSLIVQANFIDTISAITQSRFNINEIIFSAMILLLSYMLPMINIVLNYWLQECNHSFELSWSRHVNSLVKKIPYHQYEYEDTYNKIKQVASNNLFLSITSYAFLLVTTVISIISYIVILVRISPVLMISVVILSPIVGWFSAKIAEKQYKRILALNTDRRRGIYKSSTLHSREYAKDIRINNCADYLLEDWEKTQKLIDASVLNVKFKYGFLGALVLKTEYIVVLLNLVIVLFSFVNNQISLGVFISISNQILSIKMLESFKNLVTQYVNIKSSINSYDQISKITENITINGSIEKRSNVTVEVRNLYFKYPHQEEYVLKNVNIKFELGQSYAIVGENGVGKSTLIKLLIGLYHPKIFLLMG